MCVSLCFLGFFNLNELGICPTKPGEILLSGTDILDQGCCDLVPTNQQRSSMFVMRFNHEDMYFVFRLGHTVIPGK